MTRYAIATDLNRCVGCLACTVACKAANGVEPGNFWIKTLRIGPNIPEDGSWPYDAEMYFLPVQCQHCDNPECVKVCPTGASHKREDGTVQVDKEKCIGCQFCAMSCPYNVRYLNETERVVEKCTLCEQKIAQGELPQCVAQCAALAFVGKLALVGAIINAVTSVIYAIAMQMCESSFSQVGYYFDPTAPNKAMVDPSAVTNVFAGESALIMWLGVIVVGALIPIIGAFLAQKKGDAASWKIWSIVIIVAAVIGAICIRAVFYTLGLSVFALF